MRYAARVDANQSDVVKALRQIGASVTHMHTLGRGVPDLLVAFRQRWYVMEIKADGGELTPDQKRWIGAQPAPVYVVQSAEQAIEFLTRITPDWLLGLEVQAMNERTHICQDKKTPSSSAGAGNELHGTLKDRVLQTLRSSWRSSIKLSCGQLCDMLGASRAAKNVDRALRALMQEGLVKRNGNNRTSLYWAEEPK